MNAIELLSEPDCCGMPRGGNHAFSCPLALGVDCDDCGAGPGFECFPYCASMLDADLDLDDPAAPEISLPFIAVLEVDPVAEFIRWNWIINLCRPLVQGGLITGFHRPEYAQPLPVQAPEAWSECFHGWIDARGLGVADRRHGLPAASVLARRAHRDALLRPCPASSGTAVALPVRLLVPRHPAADVIGSCACGHGRVEHSDGRVGCAMGRPDGLWCGCLSFRPATPTR